MRPGPSEAARLFDQLTDDLRVFASEGIVHGDLSEYNVLVQHGRAWVIDLPQAVDLYEHPRGAELFARDVASLCRYFSKRGVVRDADALTGELLAR